MIAFLLCLLQGPAATDAPPRFGEFRAEIRGLAEPSAAVVGPRGTVWIAEAFAGRVRSFAPDGEELTSWRLDALPGLPREPRGLALGPDGALYVSDALEQTVLVLDAQGKRLRTIGKRGSDPGQLREPRGLSLHGGRLYVADAGNHRISVFGTDGKPLTTIGRRGHGDGELLWPTDVAVSERGELFVADLGNQRIARFGAGGGFERAWGGRGPYSGLFHAPTGVAARGDAVHVADRDNHRVQVFDRDGNALHDWGVHAILPREGRGKLHYPSAIALAPDGSFVAVVEGFEDRVQLFGRESEARDAGPLAERTTTAHYEGGCAAAGNLLAVLEPAGPNLSIFDLSIGTPVEITRIGTLGTEPGRLLQPLGVAFDPAGRRVWVSDPLAHRLSEFALERAENAPLAFEPHMSRFVRALDLALAGFPAATWPPEPGALCRSAQGELFVADRANGRVLVLDDELRPAGVLGSPGTGPGRLLEPSAIAVAPDGRTVFVADARARCVQIFARDGASDGEVLATRARGPRYRPAGLAFDGRGTLWISAVDGHALLAVDLADRTQRTVGTADAPGLSRLEFFKPEGLARGADGGLFVIDAGNHRFQILDAQGGFLDAWGARFFLEPALRPR